MNMSSFSEPGVPMDNDEGPRPPVHAAHPHEGFPACDLTVGPNWLTNNNWTTVADYVTCEECIKIIEAKRDG